MAANPQFPLPVIDTQAREDALRRWELTELEAQEPECTCTQTDADLFDASTCEYHDAASPWNVARRALGTIERYEMYEPVEAEECPF